MTLFDALRTHQLLALLFSALAIAARLPFLITGKIPFDSDEAVQGLMARHVLLGELPAFFWGQPFKGVPEVYAAAGAFAVFGSSVTALKSVTLGVFAMYIALNFVLLDKIASRRVAVSASLLLIVAPPALVFWSLWAGADATGFIIGFGLWDHELFVMYLIPLGIMLAIRGRMVETERLPPAESTGHRADCDRRVLRCPWRHRLCHRWIFAAHWIYRNQRNRAAENDPHPRGHFDNRRAGAVDQHNDSGTSARRPPALLGRRGRTGDRLCTRPALRVFVEAPRSPVRAGMC
ncbi:MAG TPA: hypothetical protein VM115_14200 [Vicinamibacterales bacterium]|nr:hypothetical protein [Vicinamibacterales bacterium]